MLPIFSREGLPEKEDHVFIGQAPNHTNNNTPIFSGTFGTATKLADLLCIDQKKLFGEVVWATNIFPAGLVMLKLKEISSQLKKLVKMLMNF